jgi:hypothetical protein
VLAARRSVPCPEPFDVRLTFGPLGRGPSARAGGNDWWRAMNTPDGPATLHLNVDRRAGTVAVTAWGPGRAWVIERAGELRGTGIDAVPLPTSDPVVNALRRDLAGLRLVRLGCALDVAVATVLEQRVTTVEARRAWRGLVYRHGTPAPGRPELRVPPSADVLRTLPDWEWRRLGVEQRRSATIRTVATEADRVDRAAGAGSDALDRRLRTLRGIGPWTSATVTHYVAGDTDAVPVGDWHLPGHVGFALAGEREADDARMLELLEPFRPYRAIVWRMIVAGTPRPPRRAPRAPIIGLLHAESRR